MTTNTNSAQERTASIDLAQLDKLEALARGATPGPWTATHWTCHAATTVMRSGTTSAIAETTGFGRDATECAVEAAYIAAANPATMLQLIALARRSLTSDHRETTSGAPADQALIDMEVRKDAAYYERNQVVAALAKCFPSGVAKTTIEGWSEDWHGCVYIDLPTGQVSWHFHDSQAHLFANLPPYAGKWDGHDTPEKYRRVGALEVSVGAAAKTEQAPVGYIAEDARGMLAAGRPITLNVSADNVGPWCVPIYLAASSATAAGAGSAQQADTKGAALDEPTNAEMLSALQCAERLLRAAGFTMTGTASSKIVAAIAAASRDAGQEEASTQTVPDGAAGTVEKDAARYRWLRDPDTDVALVLDKRTGWVPPDENIPGIGGYHTYEYRAGDELDEAVDAAIEAHNKAGKEQG